MFLNPAYVLVVGSLLLTLAQMLPPADLMQGLRSWNDTFETNRVVSVSISVVKTALLQRSLTLIGFVVLSLSVWRNAHRREPFKVTVLLLATAGVLVVVPGDEVGARHLEHSRAPRNESSQACGFTRAFAGL